MRRVLMVAFHFPPLAAGSGIQRTLRFAQQLPAHGWEPAVLTVHPRVHRPSDRAPAAVSAAADADPSARAAATLDGLPDGMPVHRSFALDAARDLAVRGRYLGWTARPDRWASWRAFAVRDGLRLIERWKPDLLWSTYPIATAHAIGAELQRRSGLPWVADFRDPMAQDGYPADPATWRSFQRIEETAMRRARAAVFTTPGAARDYRARYPDAGARLAVIENGYDEASFAAASREAGRDAGPLAPGRLTLLHSGIVYPSERDPSALFAALQALRAAGRLPPGRMRIRFRAPVHDALLHGLARRHGVEDLVEVCPPLGYRAALAEMLRADGLLLLQAANCNAQVPAKFYEYLRAGRPVLALTDPAGDTAGALRAAGLGAGIAPLDAAGAITELLPRFLDALDRGDAPRPRPEAVAQASREARTRALAALLDASLGAAGARP
ncbi:MAG: glycosyltransferase [Xylophilus ampelinus]